MGNARSINNPRSTTIQWTNPRPPPQFDAEKLERVDDNIFAGLPGRSRWGGEVTHFLYVDHDEQRTYHGICRKENDKKNDISIFMRYAYVPERSIRSISFTEGFYKRAKIGNVFVDEDESFIKSYLKDATDVSRIVHDMEVFFDPPKSQGGSKKLYKGPRGGKYYLKNGRKVYC